MVRHRKRFSSLDGPGFKGQPSRRSSANLTDCGPLSGQRHESIEVKDMARKPGVTVNGVQRRAQILQKAEELIARLGVQEMTMDLIADELDASKSAIYHYFKQKDDLLFAIRHDTMTAMVADQRRRMTSTRPSLELVREMLLEDIRVVHESPAKYRAIIELKGKSTPEREAVMSELEREYFLLMVATVQRAIDEGDLRPVEPRLVVQAILGMANHVQYSFNSSGPRSHRAVAEGLWDMLFVGIGSDAGREQGDDGSEAQVRPQSVELPRSGRRSTS
jgi:AcrR family transcriptional regulator